MDNQHEGRIDLTKLEENGEYEEPETHICPSCDAPTIDGECEC